MNTCLNTSIPLTSNSRYNIKIGEILYCNHLTIGYHQHSQSKLLLIFFFKGQKQIIRIRITKNNRLPSKNIDTAKETYDQEYQ